MTPTDRPERGTKADYVLVPSRESDVILAVVAVLNSAESGEYATKGRDFGRGVAYLATEIRAALAAPFGARPSEREG